jgi:SAM-dependent methyltransferase
MIAVATAIAMVVEPLTSAPPFEMAPEDWRLGRYRLGRLGLWRSLTPLIPLAGAAGARAIDVGCGSRPFDRVLRQRAYHPIGIDLTPATADCLAALPHLPFRDEAIDLAMSINVLQCVRDPLSACREMQRILRPGGRVLIVVPFNVPQGPDEYWRWTEYSAREMLDESGFEDIVAAPILPTMANEFHLLALSARKAVPLIGRFIAPFFDLLALVALRSKDHSLTGGFALRATKPGLRKMVVQATDG